MASDVVKAIRFRSMQTDEFNKFLEVSIAHYAEETILSKQSDSMEKALEEAKNDYTEAFPNGLETKNHYLMMIVNENNEDVGWIWYHINENIVYLFEFLVFDAYRRRNYGYLALKQLETIACQSNKELMKLHVFAYNTPAVNLYKKFGFTIEEDRGNGSIFMQKKCEYCFIR